MKKIVYSVLSLLVILASACTNKDEAIVNGTFADVKSPGKVFLVQQDGILDSVALNEKGEFKLHLKSPQPDVFYIGYGGRYYLFTAKDGDVLQFTANAQDSDMKYELSGTDDAERVRNFNALTEKYAGEYTRLNDSYQKELSTNPSKKQELDQQYSVKITDNIDRFSQATLKFANENKQSILGFYALTGLEFAKYQKQIAEYVEEVKDNFPGNKLVTKFADKITVANKLGNGKAAPDFEIPDVNGKLVKLSSFKGKYLLIDFWASWCGPCRQENPNVVKAYNKFHDKGFDILGVSLDDNKEKWLNAIKEDKLSWIHVSELKQWNSEVGKLYNIEAIPANFLLDRDGKIIARDLRGADLENELSKVLSN